MFKDNVPPAPTVAVITAGVPEWPLSVTAMETEPLYPDPKIEVVPNPTIDPLPLIMGLIEAPTSGA